MRSGEVDVTRSRRRPIVLAVAAALLGVLPAPLGERALGAQSPPARCSITGQNLFVRDALQDLYFWYRELPDPDPALFDSPEAYLEAVRYRPLDSSFSYISSRQADDAFFSDSQFIGFGLSTKVIGDELRVSQVFPESPAAEAGLARGQRLLEINGQPVAGLLASGDLADAFGPSEIGVQAEVLFQDREGRQIRIAMVKRLVTIPTVSLWTIYEVDGRRVGYIFFRNFVQPSYAALDAAFAELRDGGATELVLDLRYNGGGLVAVAQHLAGLIGGALTNGQVFAEFFHNDKNAFRNRTLRFETKTNALGLTRLVVITTRASASASELIVNALRPFIPVLVIGDTTFGKPVGQYSLTFCDKVLHPVAFTLRNALGQGDFYDGFGPDCAALDDLDRDLGDSAEASLSEALHWVRTGSCSGRAAIAAAAPARRQPWPRTKGWQQLVNAY